MTACYCDDTDAPTAFQQSARKAKKDHRCNECNRSIEQGETYRHVWGVWDNTAQTFKTCPDCIDFIAWFEAHVPCVCWAYGCTHEIAIESAQEYEADCPGFEAETRDKIKAIKAKRRAWTPQPQPEPTP